MKNAKRSKAQILLNSMNAIDDFYLNEALSYTPAQKKSKLLHFSSPRVRVISSVAALAAVLALVLVGPMRGMLKKSETDNVSQEIAPVRDTSAAALNDLLESCTESDAFQSVSADSINYFDGNVRLTVQRLDTQELYLSQPLTKSQQQTLQKALSNNGQPLSDAEATENGYAVWITLGNGQVATPYLTPSSGNLGAANLFHYEAECIPSEAFFDLLEDLKS